LLFAAHFCQSEIVNGGFSQFFFNSTGVLAPEAIEGFKAIGQVSVAESVQEACALFGDPYPRDRPLRHSKLKTIESQLLKSLDQRFWEKIVTANGGFEARRLTSRSAHMPTGIRLPFGPHCHTD
jgi:Domain of unknown function (DUF4375)